MKLKEIISKITINNNKDLMDYIRLMFDGDASKEEDGKNVIDLIIEKDDINLLLSLKNKVFLLKNKKIFFIDNNNSEKEYLNLSALRYFLIKSFVNTKNDFNLNNIIKQMLELIDFSSVKTCTPEEDSLMMIEYDYFESNLILRGFISDVEFEYITKNRLDQLKNYNNYKKWIKRCSREQKVKTYDKVINSFVNAEYDKRSLDYIFELYANKSRKRLIQSLEQNYISSIMLTIKKKLTKVINRNDDYLINIYYENAVKLSSENVYYNYIPYNVESYEKVKELHEKYNSDIVNQEMLIQFSFETNNLKTLFFDLYNKINSLEEVIESQNDEIVFLQKELKIYQEKERSMYDDDDWGMDDD